MSGWVYMMTNKRDGVLYVGVSSEPQDRIYDHRNGLVPGFTKRYNCKTVVWIESHPNIVLAIRREKVVKRYKRSWKIDLIERLNPGWEDLYERVYEIDNPYIPKAGSRLSKHYQ